MKEKRKIDSNTENKLVVSGGEVCVCVLGELGDIKEIFFLTSEKMRKIGNSTL